MTAKPLYEIFHVVFGIGKSHIGGDVGDGVVGGEKLYLRHLHPDHADKVAEAVADETLEQVREVVAVDIFRFGDG